MEREVNQRLRGWTVLRFWGINRNLDECVRAVKEAIMEARVEEAEDTWSRGGATDIANCQMLCKTHNRAKGNR